MPSSRHKARDHTRGGCELEGQGVWSAWQDYSVGYIVGMVPTTKFCGQHRGGWVRGGRDRLQSSRAAPLPSFVCQPTFCTGKGAEGRSNEMTASSMFAPRLHVGECASVWPSDSLHVKAEDQRWRAGVDAPVGCAIV